MADVYRNVKDIYEGSDAYKVYTQSGNDQGDMMQWDATSRLATNNAMASGAIFLGIAEDSQPLRSLGTATVPLTGDRCRIKAQGVFFFTTTNGETYNHLDAVFQGATVQTVTTSTGQERMIGRVHLPDGSQVTGNGTNTVNVRVLGNLALPSLLPSAADAAR